MLNLTCQYAIRAATIIAEESENGPILAKTIAKRGRIPFKYLQKLLRDLVRHGILSSVRGQHGGFALTRSPDEITLAEIVMPFDEALAGTVCPFGQTRCGGDQPCPMHSRWEKVVAAMSEFLENTTLANLVDEGFQNLLLDS